jgi:hypothetical protein
MHGANATAVIMCCRKLLAMNREEGIHGSQGEEVEIEEESQKGGEEEIRGAALRSEEKGWRQEEKGRTEESGSEKEKIRSEEGRSEEAGSARGAVRARTRAGASSISEPGHLPPVQPAGGRRQSG